MPVVTEGLGTAWAAAGKGPCEPGATLLVTLLLPKDFSAASKGSSTCAALQCCGKM